MTCIALDMVHDYESGVIVGGDTETSRTRVFDVYSTDGDSPYQNWQSAVGMPVKGDPHPDDPNLYARRYTVYPSGKMVGDGSKPDYDRCFVVWEYSNVGPDNGVVMLYKETVGELLEVGGGRTFVTSGAALESPLNVPIYREQIVVPRTGLPADPYGEIETCWNKVNSGVWKPTYDDRPAGYPAGTILFAGTGKRERRWQDNVEAFVWDVDFIFIRSEPGWNYAYDASTQEFDLVTPVLFGSADFSILPV